MTNRMPVNDITYDTVNDLLRYDPESGDLFWRANRAKMKAGSVAGGIGGKGYWHVSINNKSYLAHRIIWLIYYGRWPEDQLDHINHNKLDNRIKNLRSVMGYENNRNTTIRKDNKSGVIGVFWHSTQKVWESNIGVDGQLKYLGIYDNIFDAVCARKSAEIKYGFHKNHGAKA